MSSQTGSFMLVPGKQRAVLAAVSAISCPACLRD